MAVIDRLRERLQGHRPIGAAGEMQQMRDSVNGMEQNMRMDGMIESGMPMLGAGRGRNKRKVPLQHNTMTETDLQTMEHGPTNEMMDAEALGRQMGLRSLAEMAGQSIPGNEPAGGRIMTEERLMSAMNTLLRYRAGKASVNKRIIKSQEWWKLNNWDIIEQMVTSGMMKQIPQATAWLWYSIVSKHADAMDAYPEPNILPRVRDDEEEAKKLSSITPVVLEMNGFEGVYDEAWYQKLREGTGAYGVFWDSSKLGGLGDIAITKVNMLNLYWEPGINNIQDSRNLFFCTYVDKDELYEDYPELKNKPLGDQHFVDKYKTDDNLDLTNKAIVVDWYYKKKVNGRQVLHFCKFVGTNCLYSSEEAAMEPGNEDLQEGYYHDGKYPFVLDPLFKVEGSPAGYGYTDIVVGEQVKTDLLDDALTMNVLMRSIPRYFFRQDGSINEEEFMNWRKQLIKTNGNLGQDSLRTVEVPELSSMPMNMMQHHIDAIKYVTGSTDVVNGSTPQGVTTASGIAALQEAGGKTSKDSNKASYRVYSEIIYMLIERQRQFYTVPRIFRITGEDGRDEYAEYDNSGLQVQMIQNLPGQEPDMRLPVFDIKVQAQRETVFNKLANNELGVQFWGMGIFNPQLVDQSLMLLDMMDFRGKEALMDKIKKQGTIREVLAMVGQIALAATADKPQIQAQLAQVLQGVAMDIGMQSGGGVNGMLSQGKAEDADNMFGQKNENAMVANARNRVAEATRPA